VGTSLVVAVLLGLVVVLLLAVPVAVAFQFHGVEAFTGQVTIRWLFGLVRFRIAVPDVSKSRPRKKKKIEPHATRPNAKAPKRRAGTNVLAVLRQSAFRTRVLRFVRDFLRAARLHQLHLRMRVGLGDPADTGRLWALVGPLSAAAGNLRAMEIRIEPEFIEPVFEFEMRGQFRLIPLQFLALAIAFVLSPPSMRAWCTLRSNHA